MRVFELIMLVTITVFPILKYLIPSSKIKVISLVLIGVLILHLIIEGWRWQMIPAYGLSLYWIIGFLVFKPDLVFKLSFLKVIGYLLFIMILIPTWLIPNILPVFKLPATTGDYNVGSSWLHVKTDMDESITSDTADKRELMVKVWYPTSAQSGKADPYVDLGNRIGFIQKYGMGILPEGSINYLDRVKTSVLLNVPVADGAFPVLLFSPGYGSMATGYYALLSELASHGYIIFNLSHTFESLGSTFPDNTIKLFDYDYQYRSSKDPMQYTIRMQEAFKADMTFDERHELLKAVANKYHVANMVERWSNDIIYVMNQLEIWNKGGHFNGKLALDKIGVFGHSRGGGAAGEATIRDNRVKAAANLDGIQWGKMIDTIYHKPFLFLSADWPDSHPNINQHILINKSTDYFYEAKLLKSGHPNFMDIPFMVPIQSLAETGEINPSIGMKITRELVTTFFDKHLKNDPQSDPVNVKNKYQLLEMNVFKGNNVK